MNTRKNKGEEIQGAAAGVNPGPPQDPGARIEMHVNLTRLTNGEMRIDMVQMAQAITLQDQVMKTHMDYQNVPRENPPSSTMASRLGDFTRVNPPIYT